MSDDPGTRERIAALEVKVEILTDTLKETNRTVNELRDLLVGARGARWILSLILAAVSFMGGVGGSKLAVWAGWLPKT